MGSAKGWQARAQSAEDVVRNLRSGHKVFVHGAAATPTTLLDAMADQGGLEGLELYHLHLGGPCRFVELQFRKQFVSYSLFTGPSMRAPIREGRADYVPVFLSDIPSLFCTRRIPLDAALVSLSPPDEHGNCTLGPSVDAAKAACESASLVLAEINEQMPRTHGASVVPFQRVAAFVHTNRPLHATPAAPIGDVERRIGDMIAPLVDDGATLQMGIGAIPDAVLARLGDKLDLGIHTEMFSDGLIPLIENGVVTNRHKRVHPGRTVTSFVSAPKPCSISSMTTS